MLDKLQHRVGFTGTQKGMTDMQMMSVKALVELYSPGIFAHGCCIGADAQFNGLADQPLNTIIQHPPENQYKMAPCPVVHAELVRRDPQPFLIRNHTIVQESYILIAAPAEYDEVARSGTWSTLRYAKKYTLLPIFHVEPNGAVVKFNLPEDFRIWPLKLQP